MNRGRIAVTAAVAHWALAAVVQTAGYCGYASSSLSLQRLATIPLLQAQNVLVSAGAGLLAYVLAGSRWTRWLIPAAYAVVAALLLADQLFYRIALDHMRPSMLEFGKSWDVSLAVSSLSKEMDIYFWLAAAVAIAGEAVLVWTLAARRTMASRWRVWAIAAGVLLVVGVPSMRSKRHYHANEHPVWAAAADWLKGSVIDSVRRTQAGGASPATAAGAVDRNPALSQLFAAGRRRAKRPNVVLVVMESVGAVNLLNEAGLPSALYAPNLARLAQTGATFSAIYSPYPATTRSLVGLHTGGRQPTLGGIVELEAPYRGQLLGRAMQQLGYTTALFSSLRLDAEACNTFLRQCGFDRFHDFGQDLSRDDPAVRIHSWGAREAHTLRLVSEWLGDVEGTGKPFYLEYMTAATHHPYGTPPGYRALLAGSDPLSRYRNALHYTDRGIGVLVSMLEQRGLLEDTVIAVVGDHGEAFGDPHPANLAHKNFLYDENVRGFLLLFDGAWKPAEPARSSRVGSNGDVLPTLLAYLGAPDDELPGRDLLVENYAPRRVFFHKEAIPEQWGLREGNWKFIGEIRTGAAELYDLSVDPLELNNLAERETARVAAYGAACAEWFVRSDAEYAARLENYHPTNSQTIRPEDYRTPGPKAQSVGAIVNDRFVESATLRSLQQAVVWTTWVPEPHRQRARWRWISPSGVEHGATAFLDGDATSTRTAFPGKTPMEPGRWTVIVGFEDRPGLRSRFVVEPTRAAAR